MWQDFLKRTFTHLVMREDCQQEFLTVHPKAQMVLCQTLLLFHRDLCWPLWSMIFLPVTYTFKGTWAKQNFMLHSRNFNKSLDVPLGPLSLWCISSPSWTNALGLFDMAGQLSRTFFIAQKPIKQHHSLIASKQALLLGSQPSQTSPVPSLLIVPLAFGVFLFTYG